MFQRAKFNFGHIFIDGAFSSDRVDGSNDGSVATAIDQDGHSAQVVLFHFRSLSSDATKRQPPELEKLSWLIFSENFEKII